MGHVFGVTFLDGSPPEAAAALALLLFGDPDAPMPGNFSSQELSDSSPIKAVASFPQELVLLGRATVLIKGISKRLGIRWSLGEKWRPLAEQALSCGQDGCTMPLWSMAPAEAVGRAPSERPRFHQVMGSFLGSGRLLGKWAVARLDLVVPLRAKRVAARLVSKFIT